MRSASKNTGRTWETNGIEVCDTVAVRRCNMMQKWQSTKDSLAAWIAGIGTNVNYFWSGQQPTRPQKASHPGVLIERRGSIE